MLKRCYDSFVLSYLFSQILMVDFLDHIVCCLPIYTHVIEPFHMGAQCEFLPLLMVYFQ